MSSSVSHSDSDLDVDKELDLRIALERFKVDTGGGGELWICRLDSLSSALAPPGPRAAS